MRIPAAERLKVVGPRRKRAHQRIESQRSSPRQCHHRTCETQTPFTNGRGNKRVDRGTASTRDLAQRDTAEKKQAVIATWEKKACLRIYPRPGKNSAAKLRNESLGDFTTTPRVIPISALAMVIGLLCAFVALALLRLIGLSLLILRACASA
ncbi:MAG: hypothetical protein QOG55_120 [Acidobacteriaceae bacterium]|nr:hypothetical protein [Acidobacteriaceae bacterium]